MPRDALGPIDEPLDEQAHKFSPQKGANERGGPGGGRLPISMLRPRELDRSVECFIAYARARACAYNRFVCRLRMLVCHLGRRPPAGPRGLD